jgi:uncharacterized protein YukE
MRNINGIPSTSVPGVQGEIRNPIEKLSAVIGLKRKDSVWAKRHEAIVNDYEFKRQIADAAYASVSSLRAELGEAEGRRGRLNEPQSGRVSADELRTALAEADADVARAKSAYAGAVARNHKATHDMNDALRHLRKVQVLYKATDNFVSVKPSPLPKGETAQEAIDRIDAEIAKVKAAVRPQEEVVAEAMADIDRQAALAVPRVSFGKRVSISFPVVGIAAEPSGEELPHAPTPIPFICRYFRSDIEISVSEQVAERYRNVELQLSEQSKGRKLKELEAERLNADRARAEILWAKHDVDPTALLDFPAGGIDPRALIGIEGNPVKLRDDED